MSRRALVPMLVSALALALAACSNPTAPAHPDCGGVIAGSGNC